ncbi:MAG: hypothetical protein H6577_24050 [Lewinellaceae bacterium]|nr:hypothetical protein [Saprospiraceae bacterium]MCB9341208.1 hypothetical protein [Lewinellaceae bacterium]
MPNLSSLIKSIRDIMREDRGLSGDASASSVAWMCCVKIMDGKDHPSKIS